MRSLPAPRWAHSRRACGRTSQYGVRPRSYPGRPGFSERSAILADLARGERVFLSGYQTMGVRSWLAAIALTPHFCGSAGLRRGGDSDSTPARPPAPCGRMAPASGRRIGGRTRQLLPAVGAARRAKCAVPDGSSRGRTPARRTGRARHRNTLQPSGTHLPHGPHGNPAPRRPGCPWRTTAWRSTPLIERARLTPSPSRDRRRGSARASARPPRPACPCAARRLRPDPGRSGPH